MEITNENGSVRHVAIIMDGNGRWAKKRGLPRMEGHKAGAETVKRVMEACRKFNIKYLTLYAFSTENWKRPQEEVSGLMNQLKEFLDINYKYLIQNKIRLRAIGQLNRLPLITRKTLEYVIDATSKYDQYQVILALNYGGRTEITDAARKMAEDVKNNKIGLEDITESKFSSYLYAPDIPDPDLMIRTSGEYRISNFLLWQLSYSEIWITDIMWPDFSEDDFKLAINNYNKRERRFGGV